MVDKNNSPKIVVLMYHRIDMAETDPWGLCVSPKNFEQHLQVLKDGFNIISTEELLRQVSAKKIIQNAVCITFDDGYADNFIDAKPLLQRYNCPATFFITTGSIGQQKQFWWDELGNIFLQTQHLPEFLSLKIRNETFEHLLSENLLTAEMRRLHKRWKYHQKPPTERCILYLKIWERLLPLSSDEINTVMSSLKKWAWSEHLKNNLSFPMTDLQLKQLKLDPLFSLGTHTITHPDLSTKNELIQFEEIDGSNHTLEKDYGIKTNMLSYPHGRYNKLTIDIVTRLSISACFTTDQKAVNADSDVKLLGRFQAFNWTGKVFKNQLNGCMF
jgi:peptidoglycan/xylan/chitin deacetylase (PgdA/CDA1 family)